MSLAAAAALVAAFLASAAGYLVCLRPPLWHSPSTMVLRVIVIQAMNLTAKLGMMRGYGAVSDAPDYTRNSDCGGVCGRASSKATSNGDVTAGTFRWDNGPQGVSSANREGPAGNSTQWPSTLNMAATWDPTLALEWGTAMGLEFWQKGANIQEGPGIQ